MAIPLRPPWQQVSARMQAARIGTGVLGQIGQRMAQFEQRVDPQGVTRQRHQGFNFDPPFGFPGPHDWKAPPPRPQYQQPIGPRRSEAVRRSSNLGGVGRALVKLGMTSGSERLRSAALAATTPQGAAVVTGAKIAAPVVAQGIHVGLQAVDEIAKGIMTPGMHPGTLHSGLGAGGLAMSGQTLGPQNMNIGHVPINLGRPVNFGPESAREMRTGMIQGAQYRSAYSQAEEADRPYFSGQATDVPSLHQIEQSWRYGDVDPMTGIAKYRDTPLP